MNKLYPIYAWEYVENPVSGIVLKVLPSEAKRLKAWGWTTTSRTRWERYQALHVHLNGLALIRS